MCDRCKKEDHDCYAESWDHEDRRSELNALLCAFVQGAKWWEYHRTGFTMWQSDQGVALKEAERRLENGSLGNPSA